MGTGGARSVANNQLSLPKENPRSLSETLSADPVVRAKTDKRRRQELIWMALHIRTSVLNTLSTIRFSDLIYMGHVLYFVVGQHGLISNRKVYHAASVRSVVSSAAHVSNTRRGKNPSGNGDLSVGSHVSSKRQVTIYQNELDIDTEDWAESDGTIDLDWETSESWKLRLSCLRCSIKL